MPKTHFLKTGDFREVDLKTNFSVKSAKSSSFLVRKSLEPPKNKRELSIRRKERAFEVKDVFRKKRRGHSDAEKVPKECTLNHIFYHDFTF